MFFVSIAGIVLLLDFSREYFIIANKKSFIFTLSEKEVYNFMVIKAQIVAHFDLFV